MLIGLQAAATHLAITVECCPGVSFVDYYTFLVKGILELNKWVNTSSEPLIQSGLPANMDQIKIDPIDR